MNKDLENQEKVSYNGFNIILFSNSKEFQIEVRTNNQLLKSSIFKGNENLLNYIGAENYYDTVWGHNGKREAVLKYLFDGYLYDNSFQPVRQTIDEGFFEYMDNIRLNYKENLIWKKKWEMIKQWMKSHLTKILLITNEIKTSTHRWGDDLLLSIEVWPEQNKIQYIDLWFCYDNGKFILGPTFVYHKSSSGLSVIPYNLKLEKSE